MSSNASSAPKTSSTESASGGLTGQTNSQKLKAMKAARRKMMRPWSQKIIPLAIAIGVLPVLGIGALTLSVGQSLINQVSLPSTGEQEKFQDSAAQSLLILFLGIGVTATLAGGLSWLWLKSFINALTRQPFPSTSHSDPGKRSLALKDVGTSISRIQKQANVQDVLETAAREIQSSLEVDRTLVFLHGYPSQSPLQSEATKKGQPLLLDKDLSRLTLSLDQLFDVPIGYVQVCSEVMDSDLPTSHKTTLQQIKVQAQMVTQIALDEKSQGILVVQCSEPRDWSEAEHQFFSVIAQQIGIALERKKNPPLPAFVPGDDVAMHQLWMDYRNHCLELSQSTRTQSDKVTPLIQHTQTCLEQNQRIAQHLTHSQEHLTMQPQILDGSEIAMNRAISSMTDAQNTSSKLTQRSELLLKFGETMAQVTANIKTLSDQMNYEAMNASILAKKQSTSESLDLEFTNRILKITRELGRSVQELATLASQNVTENQTIVASIDTCTEQMLISTEWLKESRQQLSQLVSMNQQIQSTLNHLIQHHHEEEQLLITTHPQLVDFAHWLNQTVGQSEALLRSLEQGNQQALA